MKSSEEQSLQYGTGNEAVVLSLGIYRPPLFPDHALLFISAVGYPIHTAYSKYREFYAGCRVGHFVLPHPALQS